MRPSETGDEMIRGFLAFVLAATLLLLFSGVSTFAQDTPATGTFRMGFPRVGNPEWIVGSIALEMAFAPDPADTAKESNWYLRRVGDAAVISLKSPFVGFMQNEDRQFGAISIEGLEIPQGLYDLCHRPSPSGTDICEPHSVASLKKFPDTFEFGVISDIHLDDPRGDSLHPGVSSEEILRRAFEQLNKRSVAFILVLGDLAFMPPKTEKELKAVRDLTVKVAAVPVFFVPGNHDEIVSMRGKAVKSDDLAVWRKTFNFGFLSFDFAGIHFVGLNTYDRPPEKRNLFGGVTDVDAGGLGGEQLKWLDSDLKLSEGKPVVFFGHQDPFTTSHTTKGGLKISVFSEEGRSQLIDLMKKSKTMAYFAGHVHLNSDEVHDGVRVITTASLSSFTDNDQSNSYRIVKIRKGKIDSAEVVPVNTAP